MNKLIEKKTLQGFVVLALSFTLLLGGCARNSPEHVAEQYWQAVLAGDAEAAQAWAHPDSSGGLSRMVQPGAGSEISFGETVVDDERAVVETRLEWHDEEEDNTASFTFDTTLGKADGEWKVDTDATRQAFFDSVYRSSLTALEAALQQSVDAFRELSDDVAREMKEELRDASRELRRQSEQANQEIQKFLEELDQDLSEELQQRSGNSP